MNEWMNEWMGTSGMEGIKINLTYDIECGTSY